MTWNREKEASIGLLLSLPVRGWGMTTSYEKITKNIAIIMTHSVCTNEVEFRGEKVPEYFFETFPGKQEVQSPSLTIVHQWD